MATIETRTLTVNVAFLQEIKEVHQDLWELLERLRRRLSRPISLRGECSELVETLERLRQLLRLHFTLEEAYGYFEDPAQVAPRLSDRAWRLLSQHEGLYSEAAELAALGADLLEHGRPATLITQVADAFHVFDGRFRRHEEDETELMFEAYYEDIGVGD